MLSSGRGTSSFQYPYTQPVGCYELRSADSVERDTYSRRVLRDVELRTNAAIVLEERRVGFLSAPIRTGPVVPHVTPSGAVFEITFALTSS